MRFNLTGAGPAGLLDALAAATGGRPDAGVLHLDNAVGRGYLRAAALGPRLRLLVCQLELRQELVLARQAEPARQALTFSFRNLLAPAARPAAEPATVQVMSAGMDLELVLPAHTAVNTLLLIADAALFADLPAGGEAVPALLGPLLAAGRPFVFEELVSPAMEQVAAALVAASADVPAELRPYYLRVKAEELMCLFLVELAKRGAPATRYPLRAPDVKRLYRLRDGLLRDLSRPPHLPALAAEAGWSESKLKRLFKQVYGTSVYQYYQTARLQEAARLLRTQHLSVSEVGYRLGFDNLSHFTRVFARHTGHKPKHFSKIDAEGSAPGGEKTGRPLAD